ncbi:MAG: hypothetical protein P9L93_07875 [Candidatus Gorgyraea atricola]|nr:hypothetical protein [Candidatus Gorgyraea atricola]
MIEINLLPEEMRKKRQPQFKLDLEMEKVKVIGGAAAAGILIILVLFCLVGSFVRKKQTQRLLLKEQNFAAETLDIETINKEIVTLKAKMNMMDGVTSRRFLWAEKLNYLSDLILPGIWFTRIRTDSEDKLVVEGSVIPKQEEAMATVGKFMKNVRDNKTFFKDFSNIKLESVQRKSIDERDIVDFRIVLYLK